MEYHSHCSKNINDMNDDEKTDGRYDSKIMMMIILDIITYYSVLLLLTAFAVYKNDDDNT